MSATEHRREMTDPAVPKPRRALPSYRRRYTLIVVLTGLFFGAVALLGFRFAAQVNTNTPPKNVNHSTKTHVASDKSKKYSNKKINT